MYDYHMHSHVSFDGHDSPEDMVRAAVDAGLQEICFTDHVDDFPEGIRPEYRFTPEAYAAAYDHLSHPQLKIRRGMEFGMFADNTQSLKDCLKQREYDFILGSVHFAAGLDVYYAPYWEQFTLEQGERRYLEDVLACVKAHDDFDVLGHLTYIGKARAHPTHEAVPLHRHRELVEEIMKELIRKGKGMEINSSGVDRCGDFLPDRAYLQLFKDLGGQIVTMGSDAHNAARVGQYADQALEILKDVFGYVCTFEGRKPIFHKL